MERRIPVGLRPARAVVYDRAIVVPRRDLSVTEKQEEAPELIAEQVVQKSHHVSLTSNPNSFFDIKPQHKPVRKKTEPVAIKPLEPIFVPEPIPEPVELPEITQVELEEAPLQRPVPQSRGWFKTQYALYGMAALVFMAGMGVAVQGWLTNQSAETQSRVLSEQTSNTSDPSQPSEAVPVGSAGYKVAPDVPRTISIPSLNVNARILSLGVNESNALEAPANIYDTGWYVASAKQSDLRGAMLVDGHVSGPTKRGVFYDIKKLHSGDEIVIERGDGFKTTFVVSKVVTTKANEVDMAALLRSADENKLGLNLITCGGTFNSKTNSFESRVQVFAVKK